MLLSGIAAGSGLDACPPALTRHYPCPAPPCSAIIKDEEATFSRTLVKGLEQFHKMAANAKARGALTRGCIPGGEHPP